MKVIDQSLLDSFVDQLATELKTRIDDAVGNMDIVERVYDIPEDKTLVAYDVIRKLVVAKLQPTIIGNFDRVVIKSRVIPTLRISVYCRLLGEKKMIGACSMPAGIPVGGEVASDDHDGLESLALAITRKLVDDDIVEETSNVAMTAVFCLV